MVLTQAAGRVGMKRVLVIAHRGDSRVAPENTLPAFASAVKLGVDFVELDYHHSADGVPVVLHDKELDKRTNARALWGGEKIPVAAKTLAELRTLDAGSWFAPSYAGTRIPTLEEALEAIYKGGSLVMIERKAGDAATCIDLLKRNGFLGRVVVHAFDWDYLADCHRLAPGLIMGALGEKELTTKRVQEAKQIGAQIIGWKNEDLTKAGIDAVHAGALKAWVWTVDEPARAKELIDWGIDGLITNVPAKIKEVAANSRQRAAGGGP
ncbi:MAG: hypothetical protein HYX69_22335 [Planctomycetia bacterium]|nr:hypothetical protein [Planctomycetia bacterium]